MKFYLFIAILYSVLTPVFGQNTVTINIHTVDTSYAHSYAHISGNIYTFQNESDSVYIDLKQNVHWAFYDMGQVSCYPTYQFKSHIPDGLYLVYIDALLHEVVTFKNNKRIGNTLTYEYDFRDNEIGWDQERLMTKFTPKDCRIKRNTFNLVVFVHVYKYISGVEISCNRSVYLRKRRLCRLTFGDDHHLLLNHLIYRALRKIHRSHKKVSRLLL